MKVGRDIEGGLGNHSGSVFSNGILTSVSVGGSVIGGVDRNVDVSTFTGDSSGRISCAAAIGSIKIAGSLIGGSSQLSGGIGGDIRGSNAFASGTTSDTGSIQAKRIGSLTVGGSVVAGNNALLPDNGVVVHSGAILALQDIGTIAVKGSLVGNTSHHLEIFARGQDSAAPGYDPRRTSRSRASRSAGASSRRGSSVASRAAAPPPTASLATVTTPRSPAACIHASRAS